MHACWWWPTQGQTNTSRGCTDISYSQSVSYLGTARTKEWAAAGVKENGPMELRGCKASNTYREGNAGLSGHPPANLIHHLNMWNGADRQGWRVLCITVAQGGGCQGWGGGGWGGERNGLLFPVHKVNVSNSRVTEGIKHLTLKHIHYTTAFNTVQSHESRIRGAHTKISHWFSSHLSLWQQWDRLLVVFSPLWSLHITSVLWISIKKPKWKHVCQYCRWTSITLAISNRSDYQCQQAWTCFSKVIWLTTEVNIRGDVT